MQPITNGESKHDSDFEDIVVTRHEEERDPEAEAEFDREFAKMMSESLDSRKFDRKPMFDVPLPMRRAQRETTTAADDSGNEGGTATPPNANTMAFSLMTKKGNKQQARTLECWSIEITLTKSYRLEPLRCHLTPILPLQ